jgi:hypothetical protein
MLARTPNIEYGTSDTGHTVPPSNRESHSLKASPMGLDPLFPFAGRKDGGCWSVLGPFSRASRSNLKLTSLTSSSLAHGQLCSYICSTYYVRYVEYKYRSARKSDLMDTSNPPQADVDREQRKHKYKILRLVSRNNVNVSRNIFIPASRFSSHTHKFFHALAKRKRFAERFHSRV